MTEDRIPWSDKVLDTHGWQPPSVLVGSAFARRRQFFEQHDEQRDGRYVCPACGYPTLYKQRVYYEQCPLCHWNDDGQDDPWADVDSGGPNDSSLAVARANFNETLCCWSRAEESDFSPWNRNQLFADDVFAAKRELCLRFDRLLELTTVEDMQAQWARIHAQWEVVRRTQDANLPD